MLGIRDLDSIRDLSPRQMDLMNRGYLIDRVNKLADIQQVLSITPTNVGIATDETNQTAQNQTEEFFGKKQKEINEIGNRKVAEEEAQKREFIRRFGAFFRGKKKGGS